MTVSARPTSTSDDDRRPDQSRSDSLLKERRATTDPEVREITIDTWAIQLDNGESLRDLNVGDAVDLHTGTEFDGLWIAKEFSEQAAVITLQAARVIDNCAADVAISCRYSGTRHAHPVDVDGRTLRRPQPATTSADTFAAISACFTADLAAILGEQPPTAVTPTSFIDLTERAMHVLAGANRDHLQRAGEELDYAVGHLTDALPLTGADQRDRLARARTHLRYAIATTR